MTEREIERIAELISIKTNDRYLEITKQIVDDRIKTHGMTCQAGKFSKLMGILCAVVGGAAVSVFNWFLYKRS